MKVYLVYLLLVLLLLHNISLSRSIVSESGTQFTLQSDTRNRITILTTTNPINVTLEVNVTQVNARLVLYYQEPRGDQTYNAKTIELLNNHQTYTLQTNQIVLILETTSITVVNSTATGYYKLHADSVNTNQIWIPFKLLASTPNSLDIFQSEGSWINNVSVDIQIIDIVGGTLYVEHANSDVINEETIAKVGNYSYLVNTSFISFRLQSTNYSRVIGYYTLVDHGKLYQYSMVGYSFETVTLIIVAIVVVTKIKRENKKI